jgi:CelD/BcsL family acetyltransferase involved in cellulose biosynthesis
LEIELVPFRRLTADQRSQWTAMQSVQPAATGPFYTVEFAQLVDDVRGDVEVAVVGRAGETIAFLPFHRLLGKIGRSVGLHLSDFQGMIAQPGAVIDLPRVVRACQLAAYDFDHVPVEQTAFAPFMALTDGSPVIDLSGGSEAYERDLQERSTEEYRTLQRKQRKLERELGPMRVECDTRDLAVLNQVIEWKRAQYVKTGVPDALAADWTRELLTASLALRDNRFCGWLSALYAGDRLLAAEFGLRSGDILHNTFCAYDPEHGRYSPGRLLSLAFLRSATDNGIRLVELGKGQEEYKRRMMTRQRMVGTGSVFGNPVQRMVRGAWWTMRRWVRHSPLRGHAKRAAGYYFRLRKSLPFAKEGR